MNKTWIYFWGFIITLTVLLVSGLFLTINSGIPVLFPVSIFSSILITAAIFLYLAERWFVFWLPRVTDPAELFQRSLRYKMIFFSRAKKIASRAGVDISKRHCQHQDLPPLQPHKKVSLTKDSITIKDTSFLLAEVANFYFTPRRYGPGNMSLNICTKQAQVYRFPLTIRRPYGLEYEIDKYLTNAHNGFINPDECKVEYW
jgi:hypothetical protein